MSAVSHPRRLATVQEYFAADEASEERLCYLDGEIFVMQGGTAQHSRLCRNLTYRVTAALERKPCEYFEPGLRIRYGRRSQYGYADGTVVCDQPRFDQADPNDRTLLNPRVIFEVLSDSTERFDKLEKFELYKEIDTFEEYVLVSQREAFVRTHLRDPRGGWHSLDFKGLDSALRIRTLDFEILMRDLYRNVELVGPAMRPAPHAEE